MCGKFKDILPVETMCEPLYVEYKQCIQKKMDCKQEYVKLIECYKKLVFS